jgi:sucrose phosphorylase
LLAGRNDLELLRRSGVGRDINRHFYARDELQAALEQPVVRNLCALIRLRNTHPAFEGEFSSNASGDSGLAMRWRRGSERAELSVDFASRDYSLVVTYDGVPRSLDLSALAAEPPAPGARKAARATRA